MRLAFFVIGSGIGAPIRYLVDKYFRSRTNFPLGILIVNVAGSFILGYISTTNIYNYSFLVMGFCGALTSWSAFIIDLDNLLNQKQFLYLYLNFISSILITIMAAAIGIHKF